MFTHIDHYRGGTSQMKQSNNRRHWSVLALSIALALTMLATACSKNNSGSAPEASAPASTTSASASPEASTAAPEENIDPLGKYDPPIEVSVIKAYSEAAKFPEGQGVDNNVWTQYYLDELGIKIKYDWTYMGPADQYDQKMNVAIGSNDLPDIAFVNPSQLKQLAEAGQLEDLTEVFDKYASPLTKSQMTMDGGNALKSATFGGKLLAIPYMGSDVDGLPLLWVRTDWLKKLNLPEPKTMDDVLKIAEAFQTQDPDGNNKADTIGLGLTKDLVGGFASYEGFLNGYHAYNSIWIKDAEGKLVYSSIQPEMKTALGKLQELYKAGVIDKEFGTKDFGKVAESATSGKLGMYFGQMWTPLAPLQDGKNKDPDMEWQAYPIPSIDGKPALAQANFPIGAYYVVKKGAAHPEAAVKMLNFSYEKSIGETADTQKYMTTADGIEVHLYQIVYGYSPRVNLDIHYAVTQALDSNDDSRLVAAQKANYDTIVKYRNGDISGWGMDRVFGPTGSFSAIDQYVRNGAILPDGYYGAPTATMGEKRASLEKLQREVFTKIIMNAASIDAFDKFVDDWKSLGGDQITQEVNEWLAQQ